MKAIAYMGVLLVMIASVFATAECQKNIPPKSPDNECKTYLGEDFYGVAKFEWVDNEYKLSEEGMLSPYEISINGDDKEADWTSNYKVYPLVKAGKDTETYEGAKSGTVYCIDWENPKDKVNCHGISHVTFCDKTGGENGGNGGDDDDNEVPEFSVLTLGLAIIGAGLGLVLLRKHH